MNNSFFTVQGDTLVITHNSGFFSNCSIALAAITTYYRHFQRLPGRVDFSATFRNFTDRSDRDSYAEYFACKRDMEIPYTGKLQIYPHSLFDYRYEPFDKLAPFVEKYFTPTDKVLLIADRLIEKYMIDFSRTLTICYRGTDKYKDTGIGPYSEYVEQARTFLRQEPDLKVLVQTDQKQFQDYCSKELDNVFSFEELPVTVTRTAIHNIVPHKEKIEWTRTFVAATGILSRCKYVVNHSGNVARWICLYRGNAQGIIQYLKPKGPSQHLPGNFWLR